MSYHRAWISNLFYKLIFFGFSEQNCLLRVFSSFQFSSVAPSCPTLCDPMNCSRPGLPVHHQLLHSHLVLCRPLLLLPSIPPSIRVFSNESTLLMRWPKYWSFSFSIIPSKEHPGLISFRMDWLDLLALKCGVQRLVNKTHLSKYEPNRIILYYIKLKED